MPSLGMTGVITPLSHKPSWCTQGRIYLYISIHVTVISFYFCDEIADVHIVYSECNLIGCITTVSHLRRVIRVYYTQHNT